MSEAFPRYQVSLGANYVVRADTFEQLVQQLNMLSNSQDTTSKILKAWADGLLQQSLKVSTTQATAPAAGSGSQSSNGDEGPAPSCQHGEMKVFTPKTGRRANKRSWACQGKDAAGNWLSWSEKCKAIDIDK